MQQDGVASTSASPRLVRESLERLTNVAAAAGTFLRATALAALVGQMTPATSGAQGAQTAAGALPFAVGEDLAYRASLGRLGGTGSGTMRVEAVEEVRGRRTYRLHSDLRGRVVGLRAQDHAQSWLDPVRMTSLRFAKCERNPLASFTEAVEIYPERRQWVAAGDSGAVATDAPLDELSFIYFVRTLPLADGDAYVFERHYDAARNPARVRVVARERVTVPAGEFATVVVEMRVRDARRFEGGEGTVRINLTDDARRVPVRIASSMRYVGATVLELESMTLGAGAAP